MGIAVRLGDEVMAVQEDILEAFLKKLAESKEFDDALVAKIRAIFTTGKSVKAPELVALLSEKEQEPPT